MIHGRSIFESTSCLNSKALVRWSLGSVSIISREGLLVSSSRLLQVGVKVLITGSIVEWHEAENAWIIVKV